MGRHSAPDDDVVDDVERVEGGGAVALAERPRGRHAAPDEAAVAGGVAVGTVPAEPDTVDGVAAGPETLEAEAEQAGPGTAELLEAPDGRPQPGSRPSPGPADVAVPAPPGPAHGRHAQATRADLALIRRHGDVRARTLAAALVPFVIYVASLAVIGELTLRTALIWIWAPLIAAGVLIGLVLDAGHRRHPAPT